MMPKYAYLYAMSIFTCIAINLSSCVSARKFESLEKQNQALAQLKNQCDTSLATVKKDVINLKNQLNSHKKKQPAKFYKVQKWPSHSGQYTARS
jgi:hypothetical protein